jgi:hypothetical protein
MQRLHDLGFTKVGNWKLTNDGEIRYILTSNSDTSKVVYCFVSERKIKYVGKTAKPLRFRLDQYYKPGQSQSTNIIIHEKIIALLNRHRAVTIWILADKGELKFHNLKLSLADALEMALIKDIKYKIWNRMGRYDLNGF